MTQAQVIEGTWEEIKTHEAELAGRRMRVIVEPETVDLSVSLPAPPFTIRDQAHLEHLLLEGLASPTHEVTEESWEEIRRRHAERHQ